MALKILSIVETRPSMIKIAAVCEAIQRFNRNASRPAIYHVLVHTGQARDTSSFGPYFNDLDLPKPDIFFGVASGMSPLQKTAVITDRFLGVLFQEQPAVVLVTGDVDSTLDCALVTKRIGWLGGAGQANLPALAHIEAGIRSFDRTSPREVTRVVVDLLSDYLFTTEERFNRNLLQESVSPDHIHFVGSVLIDTLFRHRALLDRSSILNDLQLINGSCIKPFALLSLQHLCAAGDKNKLPELQRAFSEIARRMPVIFPASPSVSKRIQEENMAEYFIDHFLDGPEPWDARVRIRLIPQLGYLDFVRLMAAAKVVFTDSSGVQEETRALDVPCITLVNNASRPVTIADGVNNMVAGTDSERILEAFFKSTQEQSVRPELPKMWDGRASERIIDTLWNDFIIGEAWNSLPAVLRKQGAPFPRISSCENRRV
ncbi:MAG: UDP-N-acetyl glucosamine 2-epimerase [Deltaproteobacteria bacterium]|nr:UDP-N-acetyl glucosamine 2-epimerase [Deltaproteobacteria bacterium]